MRRGREGCSSGLGSYALDTSVLLHHRYAPSDLTEALISSGIINLVTLSEVLYIVCRGEDSSKALSYVEELAEKGRLAPSERVAPVAGQFKCRFPVSLADAWVLATGKVMDLPCLFAHREKGLVSHITAISREVEVRFLDELL
ncbi:MAG: PIN domain-containing protein [Candidatus Bathyarchaeia archaeon]